MRNQQMIQKEATEGNKEEETGIADLTCNLRKVIHQGKRADAIVKVFIQE